MTGGWAVPEQPALSWAQATPGGTWRFAASRQTQSFNLKQLPPHVPAQQPNESVFTVTGFGSLMGHQHKSSVAPSFMRHMQQHEREGNMETTIFTKGANPYNLDSNQIFAIELRKLQDTLHLAATTSCLQNWSQPWHYQHGEGTLGSGKPRPCSSTQLTPWHTPLTPGWTTAWGNPVLRAHTAMKYARKESSKLLQHCSTA